MKAETKGDGRRPGMPEYVSFQWENAESVRAMERRYYLNFRFERHIHSNMELIYVAGGEVEATIDGRAMTIPADSFCMVLPWQVHSFVTRAYSRAMVLVFSPRYVDMFVSAMAGYCCSAQVFRADPDVRRLFLKYLYEGPFPDDCLASCILLGLCHSLSAQCEKTPRAQEGRARGLYDVLQYISLHCADRLTLRDVADALGYSYYHLSHIFRDAVGLGFSQFLSMVRVSRAAALLRTGSDSMTDVAFRCGFSSIRSFNRAFAQIMEMTPSEYRARNSRIVNGERVSIDDEMEQSDGGVVTGPRAWEFPGEASY